MSGLLVMCSLSYEAMSILYLGLAQRHLLVSPELRNIEEREAEMSEPAAEEEHCETVFST